MDGAVDPDKELIALVRRGDAQALARLLRRHQDGIFSHCLRVLRHSHLAEDVAQDSMVKIINGLDSYDGRSKFSTWIYTIVHNACLSKLRSEKLRRHASLDAPADAGDASRGTWASNVEQRREPVGGWGVEHQEERSQLLDALGRLDDQQRAILILRDSRGLDYDQIAEVLGIAVGTVKSRLFRARAALREEIERWRPGGAKGVR
jgi:RNA polymerase sigma-70 factor (ECF subfamily)